MTRLQKIVAYFSKQRCGNSETGYFSPCHLDDGIRIDNGKHRDVTGGWHDASDLRKWVIATIYGMVGLSRVSDVLDPAWDDGRILDELKWGNSYFLKMQEPEGYVMNFVGGDINMNGDNNIWTDNIIGTGDDRLIQTNPVAATGQFNFIASQAIVARIARKTDPAYADRCLKAGIRCLEWCLDNNTGKRDIELGTAIEACVQLHRTTGDSRYRDLAASYARRLSRLQTEEYAGDNPRIRGFYMRPGEKQEPDKEIWQGCAQLIGLCELYTEFPGHQGRRRMEKCRPSLYGGISCKNGCAE